MLIAKVACLVDAITISGLALTDHQVGAVGLLVVSAVPLFKFVVWRAEHHAINRADRRRAERAGRPINHAGIPEG